MPSNSNFIIFGSSGFIGGHLQRYLYEKYPSADVYCCDLRSKSCDSHHLLVDVRKPIAINGDFGAHTVIFNLAAVHRTPGHPDYDYYSTNVLGAENVCDFARERGIPSIVFTSSIAPYGAAESPKTEETLPTPNTPYGISKLTAEKIHQIWLAEQSGRHLAIVRPGIVFGMHENGNFTRLYKALSKGLFAYAGRKDTRKAAIYVKDLVRIMDEMALNQTMPFQLLNCCAPRPLMIQEIVKTMQKVTNSHKWVPTIPAWPLRSMASVLAVLDSVGLGFHPDRVKKLMISTNVIGEKLAANYPLQYTLESALQDWWNDCGQKGLW